MFKWFCYFLPYPTRTLPTNQLVFLEWIWINNTTGQLPHQQVDATLLPHWDRRHSMGSCGYIVVMCPQRSWGFPKNREAEKCVFVYTSPASPKSNTTFNTFTCPSMTSPGPTISHEFYPVSCPTVRKSWNVCEFPLKNTIQSLHSNL